MLTAPAFPNRKPGFIYVRPPTLSKIKDPAATIVIYENFKTWEKDGIIVGLANGHIKLIRDESEFQALLSNVTDKPGKKGP